MTLGFGHGSSFPSPPEWAASNARRRNPVAVLDQTWMTGTERGFPIPEEARIRSLDARAGAANLVLPSERAMKRKMPPRPWLFPRPVLLVSTRDGAGRDNLITVSWAGVACTRPPMLTVSLRKSRASHAAISATKEFVANIPTSKQTGEVELCGTRSGGDTDKFAASGLSKQPSAIVAAPMVEECPINLECQVRRIIPLGSHDLFIAEVVKTHAHHSLIGDDGELDLDHLDCLAWGEGEFLRLLTGPRARRAPRVL
jgi:flavin reductase (DIM6/NTAB) family NADH-FMN oxidoreductase RutF